MGQLAYLGFLESLVLADNAIESSAEVGEMLGGMNYLRTLDLQSNPLTRAAKYRDKVRARTQLVCSRKRPTVVVVAATKTATTVDSSNLSGHG